jgi:hypothetical protein
VTVGALTAFQKKVKEINSTTTAGIYAVGGSTAHFWVNSGVQVLQKMFRENPNLSHIWLTVGGNGKQSFLILKRCNQILSSRKM